MYTSVLRVCFIYMPYGITHLYSRGETSVFEIINPLLVSATAVALTALLTGIATAVTVGFSMLLGRIFDTPKK